MPRGRKPGRKAVAKPRILSVKNVQVIDGIAPDLKAKRHDAMYFGSEPRFVEELSEDKTKYKLTEAFNWYNQWYDKKDAKVFIIEYLTHQGKKNEAKAIKKVADKEFDTTWGFYSRILMRGFKPNEDYVARFNKELDRLFDLAPKEVVVEKEEVVSTRPNVQEIMRERALEAAGEFEGWLDDFIAKGVKSNFNPKVVDELTKRNVMQQHVGMIIDAWSKHKAEFAEVLKGKDEQLVEAYSRFTNTQMKNLVKFTDQIISDLNSYITLKKTTRKPRARKAVPVEKQVAKLKFMKVFKSDEAKLDLVSLHPAKLVGASEAWVYDTQKRKLHHYVADDLTKVFQVKGNVLLGFCTKQSEIKTLRKPAEQLKNVMGSKPVARKYFSDIKSVSVTPTGRFNENLIILKAF